MTQLLFEVGVDQHAIVEGEAGIAVEGVDQCFLTVAGGGQVAGQRQQALDRGALSGVSDLMKCSTGTRLIRVFMPICGTAGRTSSVPLVSKLPSYRPLGGSRGSTGLPGRWP